jgi:hypothetical protein
MRAPRRRLSHRGSKPSPVLAPDHKALLTGGPLFPSQVRSASPAEWSLKSGEYSKKLGSHFSKGPWRGMPIYSLALPERTTCPRSCQRWSDCYGNQMPFVTRFRVDTALYAKLRVELDALGAVFPLWAVRLHTLGDFPNLRYVRFWLDALQSHAGLHLFGFTAWPRNSEIGRIIERESGCWERFRIRFSGTAGPRGATVVEPPAWGRTPDGVVCPAQHHRPDVACGSCSFCVTSTDPVVFVKH